MALSICLRQETRRERRCAEEERTRRVEYRKARAERHTRRKEIRKEMRRVREFAELVRMGWPNDETPVAPTAESTERQKR